MKIGILGTGSVGQTMGTKLASMGHSVCMGSRDASNEKATAWAQGVGDTASNGTFADAAAFGEIIVNATSGAGSLPALGAAGQENLNGKIIIDISNPLQPGESGMSLSVSNTDSLGEQNQRAVPNAHVVKAFNTVTASVMVDPASLPGEHNIFVAGNDAESKMQVAQLLGAIGWKNDNIIDLGDITGARGMESYLLLWVRLYQTFGNANFNIALSRG